MSKESKPRNGSRREFIAKGALLGGGLLAAAMEAAHGQPGDQSGGAAARAGGVYELADAENIIHTVCLQCNTGCGIKCKLHDGLLAKVDGNPYSPWTLLPHLPQASAMGDAAIVDGAICPKGQAGLQSVYDPYRLRKVLKRSGPRGSGQWVTIPFDQAIAEIVDGGRLFAHVPGEENRQVAGLREIMALTDGAAAKAMADDVKALWDKKLTVQDFKAKHAAHLDRLIDAEHPDLGPRNNQFVINWGRLKGGRSDFIRRFAAGYGTVNTHGHTTVCQGSLYFTCKGMSEQYDAGSFSGGKKFYWQADTENSRFILFVGANLFEANYGPPNRTVRLTNNLVTGRTRIAVVDPRFSKLASKAWKWLPIKPGEDAALGMAILRWMLENGRYDQRFLENANKAAAAADGEPSWSNATWLVKLDAKGNAGPFARAADHGLAQAETRQTKEGKEYQEKFILAMRGGQAVAFDPNDTEKAVEGDLFVDAALPDGTRVKSSLQLLREAALEHTLAEWCAMADLDTADVTAVAQELTSHGKAAAVDIHRGVSQHTDGFYGVLALMSVNVLLGNFDHKGGLIAPSTYGYDGSKGGPFALGTVPGSVSPFGVSIIRHETPYEKTTLFAGYPARRPWYPLSSDVYEEIAPSIGDAYPYPVKALFLYMGTPIYALPAGHTNVEILADPERLPLFFASDIVVGTTSMYADYIFPDLSYLERWEMQGSHPNVAQKVQPVRQPAIAPIPETSRVYGQEVPICIESVLMALAERLGLKAFGPDALGPGQHLRHPDDFYLRAVANVAAGDKPDLAAAVPDADAQELDLFVRARRHLPGSVFDAQRWQQIVGKDLWPKVVRVLNRGGRFQDYDATYKGQMVGNPYGALVNLYQEKTAKCIHPGTGEHFSGIARRLGQRDYLGRPLDALASGHDLTLITNRTVLHTKSRTISNYWLLAIQPENAILMNPLDARRLGLSDSQRVRVVSSTNPSGEWPLGAAQNKPMVGMLKVTETMRPGVVTFVLGYGHWATGAQDVTIDGVLIKGDPRRAAGVHANAAMWIDPALKNTCLLDPVGGSVSFYDTAVSVVPA